MNLADVAKTAASVGLTALGTALAGPAGGAVASTIAHSLGLTDANPATINAALGDPTNVVKLKQIEASVRIAQISADAQSVKAVNMTMQAEAASEHWPTYSWRPFIGACFGVLALFAGLAVVFTYGAAMLGKPSTAAFANLPGMLQGIAAVMFTIAPVLGVSAWHRGRMQVEQAKANNGTGT